MSHATPKLRCYAVSLIRHEATVDPSSSAQHAGVVPVFDKMRPMLGTFMGRAGYHALILRALVLAQKEAPCLLDVTITADGSLENFAQLADKHKSDDVSLGSEVLLAHLIGLLVAFIGEILTLRLIHELWPDLSENNNFTLENEHEQFN